MALAEPGADRASQRGPGATISAVNMSEVIAKLLERGASEQAISDALRHLDLKVIAFDEVQAFATARLGTTTRALGLSLADRACLALGQALRAPIVTADRAWAAIGDAIQVEIDVIR